MQLVARRDHLSNALTRVLLAAIFAVTLGFGLIVDARAPDDSAIKFDQLSQPGHDFAGYNRIPASLQSSSIA